MWHDSQRLSWKSFAPLCALRSSDTVMVAGRGGALNRGDQGASLPSYQNMQTPTTTTVTHATAQGRRVRLRSPRLKKNGSANMEPKINSGARIMMPDSNWCGLIARMAKYHRRYQSGRGSALSSVG